MTPAEEEALEKVRRGLARLADRVDDLENERDAIKRIPQAVGELKGMTEAIQVQVNSLMTSMTGRFDNVEDGIRRATPGWDFWLKFIIGAIVPVALTIIGGYFALKAGVHDSSR
jgi:hypothetical protein